MAVGPRSKPPAGDPLPPPPPPTPSADVPATPLPVKPPFRRPSPRAAASTPFRRSPRLAPPPQTPTNTLPKTLRSTNTKRPATPATPDPTEPKRRRWRTPKRIYYRKVVYDEGVFEIGDDVYVKRKEGSDSDEEEDPDVEECRICFVEAGEDEVMLECDDCLGGFHLGCLDPPLKKVPEGDWVCVFCDASRRGKKAPTPSSIEGRKLRRTAKERLLSSDLWAARIESLFREPDGRFMAKVCWYIIPEETAAGRQKHNLKRELYLTNDLGLIEMESIIRHCYVMSPKEYAKASDEGDDVFLCEYEYDINWHSFKRIIESEASKEDPEEFDEDKDWISIEGANSDAEDDSEYEKEGKLSSCRRALTRDFAANSYKGRVFGLQRIGMKKIPEHARNQRQSEIERAKATLLLAASPKTLPCRSKEMAEITAFVKGSLCDDKCLGRCLYVHGVPGTGKTLCVLSVLKNLRSEIDVGTLRPYSLIEINCLKLSSPENIYKVIYEAISGHRVGWKKALHQLNERFSVDGSARKDDRKPCIVLIDELDLLVTRNQSVLYNILDWPTRMHSNLVIIGIANTMDLPEKILPRISSRMGIQRLCFGPYNYRQLQDIILSRLNGINAFETQAIEFASRKVAAISGDARRALEVCRRAAELADYRLKQSKHKAHHSTSRREQIVEIDDVEAAIQEMFQAPHIQVMRCCSRMNKIILAAIVRELYKTGMADVTFEKLARNIFNMCSSNGEVFPGWDTLMSAICKLGQSRIVHCEEATKHRLQKVQLNFPSDDVAFALKNCEDVPWLTKYL